MIEDPFALLDLDRRFEIDPDRLEAAYRRRVAALHPDRHADPLARAEAAESAARLNDARAVLRDDERRADTLLRLLGGPTKEDDKTLPDGFLMEVMERREAMADVLAGGDDRERRAVEGWATAERDRHRTAVAALFERAAEGREPSVLVAIRRELNAWRYIERMLEQLDPEHEPLT